ncbi:MAG: carbamoyltransferase HypF [Pirellulaceae bacterium]|nr:carbamoyltransferase HypF [Pirellulaceae bacterium]
MQRRAITISGVVQGIGFRPFVYRLASQMHLHGFVLNRSGQLLIEVQGKRSDLDQFIARLQSTPPPLSRIDQLTWACIASVDELGFRIAESGSDSITPVFVSPDIATCSACRRELFDPANRRHGYPFLSCTQCGPRLTIIQCAPYDRINTTMASFAMCDRCQSEYNDPSDRRFHAQPIACPDCGPQMQLLDGDGCPIETDDPIKELCAAFARGEIAAIKGIGGYHLVCSATDAAAIKKLRLRKNRDEKPFALMVADADVVTHWCSMNAAERASLESIHRPIVLLRKCKDTPQISSDIAPDNSMLGLMLPYTPLHALLLDAWGDRPLVMTSGNRSDEPIAKDDSDAIDRLQGIADLFLVHNRPIRVRCDDSVTRIVAGIESPIRRSRGYAPMPIQLPYACDRPTLAVGGQLKNVFALARGDSGFLSHHIGDLEHLSAFSAMQADIVLYEQLFGILPERIVHDLHPDYASTTYALERAERESMTVIGVQHHHAHLASCMAEHRLDGKVIGVVFDGSGYDSDGTVRGGEFLVGGYESVSHAARLRRVRLPGGDRAAKEPWRMALSYLIDAECDVDWVFANTPISSDMIGVVQQMIARGFNSPWTSSAGRLFDAVAALAGVRLHGTFEGQTAMQLESRASGVPSSDTYPYEFSDETTGSGEFEIDTRSMIQGIVRDRRGQVDSGVIARRFHDTLSAIIVGTCLRLADETGLDRVALSGGVFINAILCERVVDLLTAKGLRVFRHQVVPCNDGGLCLGQLAIAARVSE